MMRPQYAATLRWADRRSLRLISSANQHSTRFSPELLVGVKCRWNCGCVLRRAHVEADDVADLPDELRVGAQLPRLHGVRLQPEGPPDPRDDDCDSPVSAAIVLVDQ
jgi:hypothetical protein